MLGRTDSERTEHLLKELVREFGTAAIKSYVRLTPGVDVRDWPHEEDTMHFALKSIMKNKPAGTQLATLPWLSFYTSRDKEGHFSDKFAKERNLYTHIGCLFGHMFQWQLAADANDKHAFMLESDAFDRFHRRHAVQGHASVGRQRAEGVRHHLFRSTEGRDLRRSARAQI